MQEAVETFCKQSGWLHCPDFPFTPTLSREKLLLFITRNQIFMEFRGMVKFLLNVYLFFRERERERHGVGGGGESKERETQNPKQVPGLELSAHSLTQGSSS